MGAVEYTKRERQKLRELASIVYEAEPGSMLEDIAYSVDQWCKGKLPASERSEVIHALHQGGSRQPWSMYQTLNEPDILARGIALGLFVDDIVTPPPKAKLGSLIAFFRGR